MAVIDIKDPRYVPSGLNRLPERFELKWVAGQRGKPGINGDILSTDEATREIADPDFELLGTNAVATCSAYAVEGGVTLTTTTGANDQVILVPHLDASQSAWGRVTWGTDQETVWECQIKSAATITSITIWAGLKLTNTSVTATDAEQVFFRVDPAVVSGDWQAVDSIGGTDVETDTNIALVASTVYRLRIEINSSRVAKMFINDILVRTTAALTAGDLIPYIGVETTTTAARAITVHGQAISRNFA